MKTAFILPAFLLIAACTPPMTLDEYRPVVDPGKTNAAKFEQDLVSCRNVAKAAEADYKERAMKEQQNQMVAGLIIGAIAGAAIGGDGSSAAAGAAYGGAVGGLSEGDTGYDMVTYGPRRIVDRCMTERGYAILNDIGRG